MICYARQTIQNRLVEGNSGSRPSCVATLASPLLEYIMNQVKLYRNRGVALVDNEDFEIVSRYKWSLQKNRGASYAQAKIKIRGKWGNILMHRMILKAKKGQEIDHQDGDGLNNQKTNLRFCTNSQNQMNKKGWGGSKYKGVCWHKPSKKWGVYIKVNDKQIHLGLFDSEIDAAKAYDKAAIKYFEEFARTNFKLEQVIRNE